MANFPAGCIQVKKETRKVNTCSVTMSRYSVAFKWCSFSRVFAKKTFSLSLHHQQPVPGFWFFFLPNSDPGLSMLYHYPINVPFMPTGRLTGRLTGLFFCKSHHSYSKHHRLQKWPFRGCCNRNIYNKQMEEGDLNHMSVLFSIFYVYVFQMCDSNPGGVCFKAYLFCSV